MSKVGEILRKRRDLESKSLEDIASQTMIAKKYIVALEEGSHDVFPGKVYAKGFLRNYANFLEFDEDEVNDLISQYELEWRETHLNMSLPSEAEKEVSSISKTNWLFYMIICILIIGLSILLTFYFTKQKIFQQESSYDPTKMLDENYIPKINEKIEDIKKFEESPIEEVVKPQEVSLEAFAFEKVWMQAIIDGDKKHEVLLGPDQKVKWQAKKDIFLTIGNAGGVVFKLNEEYMGALGRKGEKKKMLVTSNGFSIVKTYESTEKEKPPLAEKMGALSTTTSTLIETPATPSTTLE